MDQPAGCGVVRMEYKDFYVPSTDGHHTLHGYVFEPVGKARGYVQIVHGMTDYTLRYRHLMEALAEAGYLAFGYDQLGHGTTANTPAELGFIAEKDGWRYLIQDVSAFSRAIFRTYGEAPLTLLGHSMGSFVVRLAALEEAPRRLILLGSGDADAAAPLGRAMTSLLGTLYGKRHISHLMQALVFSDYDRKFEGDWPNRWITVDTENLVRYKDDPFCTFRFSVSALGDLIRLNERSNSPSFYKNFPKETEVFLLSGSEDPVGDYGSGLRRIHRRLTKRGIPCQIKLYEGYRHEILQDFCKDQVIEDILSFLE